MEDQKSHPSGKYAGKLTFSDGTEALLSVEGEWLCDDQETLMALNSYYNPANATGVANLFSYGIMTIQRAARDLGARAEVYTNIKQLPEGVIS